jgi:hypothetical protein
MESMREFGIQVFGRRCEVLNCYRTSRGSLLMFAKIMNKRRGIFHCIFDFPSTFLPSVSGLRSFCCAKLNENANFRYLKNLVLLSTSKFIRIAQAAKPTLLGGNRPSSWQLA